MKANDIGSPQRVPSRAQSTTSSKLNGTGRPRKITGKNLTSVLLQQRHNLRVLDNDADVTPKTLTHPTFSSIDEKQITAFEAIGLAQTASAGQLMISPSGFSSLKTSSSIYFRSSSQPIGLVSSDDIQIESLLSTQTYEDSRQLDDEDRPPSPFYLSSIDPNIFPVRPETITITLKETETFIFFEMLPLTGDLRTPEGEAIKEENDNYEYITTGPGSNRKLVNSETQTLIVRTRSRGTYLERKKRKNQGIFVNNWVMHDTYAAPELMTEQNGYLVVHSKESVQRMIESQDVQYRLPKEKKDERMTPEEELIYIFRHPRFWDAMRVMERIISNNVFINVQKRFTGLIKKDPCSLDLEFTYSLDLLWTHTCETSRGRPVSSFRWNYTNKSILAVAYGAQANSETKDGLLLLWCVKNPEVPARNYNFDCEISDIDWSRNRPNLLVVGFYDGAVKVVDVSKKDVNVIRQSRRITSPSCSPHWQVQWWPGDEQFAYEEQIYTCNQDGRIFCYRSAEDFTSTTIMRIFRIDGKIPGVERTNNCHVYDVPISRHPGLLVLRRHPTASTIYFVGSDEGCIYRCSTNYLYQHIDSFLAHDGPVYSMEFSPFCPKIFLTCGADWCTRIWAEGITDPLITLCTTMACVRCATWCPTNSTVIVSIVNNEICMWDIRRKTYIPTSVTVSSNAARFVMVGFTSNGNQLVAADTEGVVQVYNLEGMPFPPYNQQQVLIDSIEKSLITKPGILKKLRKLGPPFS